MLSGAIIGVGMFAIPFSFSVAGFWLGVIELCVLAAVVLMVHLCYGEVVLHTQESHRLPGYVRRYLGDNAATLAHASTFIGIVGTLLAYMLLAGVFLHGLLNAFIPASSPAFWSIMFVIACSTITFFSLRKKTFFTSIMTAVLIGFLCLLIGLLLFRFNSIHLEGINVAGAFTPYGILLFALSGITVIPDVINYLKGTQAQTRRIITWGSLIPAILYFLFALAVVGASGKNISTDAMTGLSLVAGPMVVMLGNIIGLLAVMTAYVILNSSFQAFLTLDAHVTRRSAWAAGSLLPIFLFIIGFQNFISVISILGATIFVLDGGLILATYHVILHRREQGITIADTIQFGLIYAIMIAGIGYELYRFVGGFFR